MEFKYVRSSQLFKSNTTLGTSFWTFEKRILVLIEFGVFLQMITKKTLVHVLLKLFKSSFIEQCTTKSTHFNCTCSKGIQSCSHHLNCDVESFCHLSKFPCAPLQLIPSPQPWWQPRICFLSAHCTFKNSLPDSGSIRLEKIIEIRFFYQLEKGFILV